jgi:hypothetical protein
MESVPLLDCAGRRRSPATLPGYHQGRPPRNKGLRYPADPPTVEEIIAVMRATGDDPDGRRLRGRRPAPGSVHAEPGVILRSALSPGLAEPSGL